MFLNCLYFKVSIVKSCKYKYILKGDIYSLLFRNLFFLKRIVRVFLCFRICYIMINLGFESISSIIIFIKIFLSKLEYCKKNG